ncbi:hypothetical protein G6F57_011713 [Rhizopus arrhizus]|uniref:Uncharacterized protein n=1 Tax=Rhizopus oryzae TaxID=64495 RepID=A0A9P6WZF8_RHIOR|nr:hypothetical protein G6F30_011739 [Rhizopus arrhizus]KAG1410674.1 hypothetical protein G6F58_008981 [Rhizopus delemar]KAG0975013.1 hypothetical protein G6F29_011829 [Rhizopus arrhizus]KAG0980267.1 hypothetical protein G6F28_011691 [Rhizopus arrhizus]KAG1002574.1 hypothetical protein G6F27_011837 [Rhizopus arrhizus]
MIRAKYKFDPGITDIDEKPFEIFLQKPLNFESREEEEEEDSHRDGSKIEEFSDASVQSNIEDFSSSHTNQISRFLPLVTEQVPVKTAAADAGNKFNLEY